MGSGGGSSNSSGTQTNTLRYAPYIEKQHTTFLNLIAQNRNATIGKSPFATYSPLDINTIFMGAGVSIAAYGSLFGKIKTYVQDVNIDALYADLFSKTVNSAEVKAVVKAEGALLDEDIVTNSYPRLMTGARDLNAVMSSTFVIGKANIEASRVKVLNKFSAGLKYTLVNVAVDRWKTSLEWRKWIVNVHASAIQQYVASTLDMNEQKYAMYAKNSLWPFTVLDHERAALGALQTAISSKSVAGEGGASTTTKAIGGAVSGAAIGGYMAAGTSVGGPWGAAIGAVVGGVAALLM